ncbi:MAG: ABC transporter permease [Fimbriimonadaceae bacterium]|nr:ABC transporter permease [Fimbriimonadaceae bacterium]
MTELLTVVLNLTTPLVLAAIAGYLSERAGVINIALEGKMLAAACTAGLVGMRAGPIAAVIAAMLVAAALSLAHVALTQRLRIDQVVSGMALNAVAAGGTNFLFSRLSDQDRSGRIPALPNAVFWTLAVVVPIALSVYVQRSRAGIHLIAAGSDAEKARLAGLHPLRIRTVALIGTGLLTGLAGAFLVADTGVFTDNMTAGRGYIALAALILGGWRILPATLSCIVLGLLTSLGLLLQGTKINGGTVPSEFWTALPYLATVLALAGFLGRNRTPTGLGKV